MGCGSSAGKSGSVTSTELDGQSCLGGGEVKGEDKLRNAQLIAALRKIAFCEPGHRIVDDLTEDVRKAAASISSRQCELEEIESNEVPDTEPPPPLHELRNIALLGCGGFAHVDLMEHESQCRVYALKTISKGYVVKTGMQENLQIERLLLSIVRSPFVVSYFGSYNRNQTISLLTEPLLGGELYATYNRHGLHGKQDHARYYVASITMALEYLHSLRIVCRGIKPEDCALDSGGHLKLIDLGLSKPVAGLTYTTCGTPDYFAPELIASSGHSLPVDWWALGVLCYELLAGHPPFESAYPMQIYQKVIKGMAKVQFPTAAKPAQDLVVKMCTRNPRERLPVSQGGVTNLKEHTWFEGFDWGALEDQSMKPPYIPKIRSATDTSNFSARKEDMPRHVTYVDTKTGWDKEFGPLGGVEPNEKAAVADQDRVIVATVVSSAPPESNDVDTNENNAVLAAAVTVLPACA